MKLRDRQVFTGTQLHKLPPLRWLVPGILPERGITAIVGKSYSGKSLVALDLAAGLVSGTSWPGGETSMKPRPVLYCYGEGDGGIRGRVEAILRKFELTEEERDRLMLVDTVPFLDKGTGGTGIDEALAEKVQGGVLIVDTYVLAVSSKDTNSNSQTAEIFDVIRRLCSELNIAVVLVHHVPKADVKGVYAPSGSYQFAASCDVIIEVENPGNVTCRVSKCRDGRRLSEFYFRIQSTKLDPEDGDENSVPHLEVTDTSLNLTVIQKQILRSMAGRGIDSKAVAVRVSAIADLVECDRGTAYKHIRRLESNGLVHVHSMQAGKSGDRKIQYYWLDRDAYSKLSE